MRYFFFIQGFDESGREVMFTAAIAPGKDDKKSPPPVAGIPDNVLNRVPFKTKNPIINRTPIDGSHRLDGLDIDVIYNAGLYIFSKMNIGF